MYFYELFTEASVRKSEVSGMDKNQDWFNLAHFMIILLYLFFAEPTFD